MMSRLVPRFHHVGLLTDQPELAVGRLARLGYTAGPEVFDPLQEARLRMCSGPGAEPRIELITPGPGNPGLGKLLKRRGDYMYHVCYEVDAIDDGVRWLQLDDQERLVEVVAPRPAVLFGGRRVAFYATPGLGLVEFLEMEPAAASLP
jgi:methylmalonyl-CoA/ethylmalonyl-CoA epimerase